MSLLLKTNGLELYSPDPVPSVGAMNGTLNLQVIPTGLIQGTGIGLMTGNCALDMSGSGILSALNGDNEITGALVQEEPTHYEMSVVLPINAGKDADHNATVTLEYRLSGASTWIRALDMFRVRPEFSHSSIPRSAEFCGTIWRLEPGQTYELRATVTHPTETGGVELATFSTRALPRDLPQTENVVSVSNSTAFQTALAAAQPGDHIKLDPGTYDIGSGNYILNNSGTEDNPIFISGLDTNACIIRGFNTSGTGQFFRINGSYVTVQDLTFQNSANLGYAVRADSQPNQSNVTIRRCKINSDRGIRVWTGTTRRFSIYKNILTGRHAFGLITNVTWDSEGIAVTGQGHAIFNNVLSGYGDSLGFKREYDLATRSCHFKDNRILWGGDDAFEADDGVANISFYDNLVGNSATLASAQHNFDTAGPIYFHSNIGINLARRPLKLNDGPTGVYFVANTIYVTQDEDNLGAWGQFNNGEVRQINVQSNIVDHINTARALLMEAPMQQSGTNIWDNNGWSDGVFQWTSQGSGLGGTYSNLADYQTNSPLPFDKNSIVLTGTTFETEPTRGAVWDQQYIDVSNLPGLTLDSSSNARGSGVLLHNINGQSGTPDLGAIQFGDSAPSYGVNLDQPVWRQGLTPGVAKQLTNVNTTDDLNPYAPAVRGSNHLNTVNWAFRHTAWNGAVATYDDIIRYLDGGHSDGPFNDILGHNLPLDIPLISRRGLLPTNIPGMTPHNSNAYYSDGLPRASHTYDTYCYIGPGVNGNRLFTFGSSTVYPGGSGSQLNACRSFSLDTNTHDPEGFIPNPPVTGDSKQWMGRYDEATHTVKCISTGGFLTYDVASKTWTNHGSMGFPTTVEWTCDLDPDRRIILITGNFGTGSRVWLKEIDSPYRSVELSVTPIGGPAINMHRGKICYDPVKQDYVGWNNNGNSLQIITPPAGAAVPNWSLWSGGGWTRSMENFTVEGGGTIASVPGNGIFSDFNYIKNWNTFVWWRTSTDQLYTLVRA
jgi:hypothetical protein